MTNKREGERAGLNTRLTHAGNDPHAYFGFVNPPVVHASTVLFPDAASLRANENRYTYGVHATPTTDALTDAVNQFEGSAGTILLPSGLAAVTEPLLAFLSAGDHLLMVDTVYYPTRRFAAQVLARMGVETEYYRPDIGAGIEALIRPNTRVVFLECPGSNTYEMMDVPAIASVAAQRGVVTMADNTWATPMHFRPLEHGVDISIQAATKYPAGHSDVLLGWVSANARTWEQLDATHTALGTCVGPDDAYQVLRGMRTMGVRFERHDRTARALAQWLQGLADDPASPVAQVLHPALETSPGHAIWQRDFTGAAGLFSIVLHGGIPATDAFLNALGYFGLGYSWGGFESLAVRVDLRDRTVSAHDYPGEMVRLQIGLEDEADLKADIAQALDAAAQAA